MVFHKGDRVRLAGTVNIPICGFPGMHIQIDRPFVGEIMAEDGPHWDYLVGFIIYPGVNITFPVEESDLMIVVRNVDE